MPIDDNIEDPILSDIEEQHAQEQILLEQTEKLITCAFDRCSDLDTVNCKKCSRPFCVMHSNRFSPNFCKECFVNLACIESKFTRTFEDFDTKNDKLVITRESCTKYYMDGPDWPFLTAWIDTLSDNELKTIWNFHFFVMKTIEAENEVRKIKKYKKIRENPVVKTVSTLKAKVTKIVANAVTADDWRKKFKKQGLDTNTIEAMITAMGIK